MLQINTVPDSRQSLRRKIRPFDGGNPEKQTFCVGWIAHPQTFEQIMNVLRPKVVHELLYFRKIARHYIGDLLQQGWLRLWEALQENSNLLLTLSCQKAADYVSNRCGVSQFRDYLKRYDSYHHISRWNEADGDVYEDSITEIVVGSSLKSAGKPGHALFTRVMDRMLDIQQAIREVVDWCEDDLRKLVALYYVTTSVSHADAGRVAGFAIYNCQGRQKCPKLTYWTRIVKSKLQEVFASYRPIEPNRDHWREQIQAGVLQPVIELASKYAGDTERLQALYVLVTSVSRDLFVQECGVSDSALWYRMKQLRQELRWMYARPMYRCAG